MVEEEIVRIYIKEVYFSVCKLCGRHIGVNLDSPKDRLNDFWSPKRVGEDIDAKLKKNLGGSNNICEVEPLVTCVVLAQNFTLRWVVGRHASHQGMSKRVNSSVVYICKDYHDDSEEDDCFPMT